jgi:peptide/nickel transport system substrate-binding protein
MAPDFYLTGEFTMKTLFLSLFMTIVWFAGSTEVSARTFVVAVSEANFFSKPAGRLTTQTLTLAHTVFDPLVRTSVTGFNPCLATAWEAVGAKTMRFHLRKAVSFHSGNLFTADDVKWTINRFKTKGCFKEIFAPIVNIQIIDDHTIDIVARRHREELIRLATYLFPLDSHFYQKIEKKAQTNVLLAERSASSDDYASGTGPYKMISIVKDESVIYQRFVDYWDTQSPGNIDEIIIESIKDNTARISALLSGQADLIIPLDPGQYEKGPLDAYIQPITIPACRIMLLQMNQTRRFEFKDPLVRLAMVHAIDKQAIDAKISKGLLTPSAQLSMKEFQSYNENLTERYNLEMAKALMKKAGLENGFECTMIAPGQPYVFGERIGQAIVDMLAAINIKIHLKIIPMNQYDAEFDAKVADIQMIRWQPYTQNSCNMIRFLQMCPDKNLDNGKYNSGNYCNPQVDDLVIKAQNQADLKQQARLLKQAEKILYDEGAFIPLFWESCVWAAKRRLIIAPHVHYPGIIYFKDIVLE